jgi:hypothetical protein
MQDRVYDQILQTEHFQFKLSAKFTFNRGKCSIIHLYVGEMPHQALSITLPFAYKNSYNLPYSNTVGNIAHIKKFREALLTPVSDEMWNEFSFPTEMMHRVLDVIRTEFPYVKHLTLEDDSQLPCSSNPLDKLDLLYYYTALHQKSWYEKEFDAYFLPRDAYVKFKCDVFNFGKPLTKEKLKYDDLENNIMRLGNPMIRDRVASENEVFRAIFESANTIPDFLQSVGHMFKREEKCYVFKGWINELVRSHVGEIPRNWIIDLYQARSLKNVSGRRFTRKKRKIALS